MEIADRKELIAFLSEFAVEDRLQLFQEKIEQRTSHLTVAVENIFQEHNTSAVLRSADCFGIQNVHIIENSHRSKINADIALGSSKWLTVHQYAGQENNTLSCINHLKSQGYKIVATTPHKDDFDLEEYDISSKTALVFGTEKLGLSDEVIENADAFLKVPMLGFTESLNISVCAGICMHYLSYKMRSTGNYYGLEPNEKEEVMLSWLMSSIKSSESLVKEFYKRKGN